MRGIVLEKFHAYKQNSEGNTSHMYCDVNNNVTIGVGVTSFSKNHMLSGYRASASHWTVKDKPGTPVTEAMVEDDYQVCQDLYATGITKVSRYAEVTALRLNPGAGSFALTKWKMGRLEPYVRNACPLWNTYPADAQFACIAMMWGPGLWATLQQKYRALTKAIEARDFAKASTLITFPVKFDAKKRQWLNKGFEFMLVNAAVVVAAGLNRDTLYWPCRWAYDGESDIAYQYDCMPEKL